MSLAFQRPRSSWAYIHARGRGHYFSHGAAIPTNADLNGPQPRKTKALVIALHCSGSSGRQWQRLAETLGEQYVVVAPDFFGSGARSHWSGERPFNLADEAAPVIDIIDAHDAPAHLVGHSYGGAIALRVALSRPTRVASLALYEPVAFHLLKSMGPDGRDALREFDAVIAQIDRAVLTGAYRSAAERLVDYWNGTGAWAGMKPESQAEIARYIPKVCLEARAVAGERTPLVAYGRLGIPTLLMQGECGAQATALIVRKLARVMKSATCTVLEGANHMGPLFHSEDVNRRVQAHIMRATSSSRNAPFAAAPSRAAA